MVGKKGWKYNDIFNNDVLNNKRILFTGFVEDEDLPILLSEALALCFISFYEGFGLPLLVYCILKVGSLSSKYFKTTCFAFSPLGTLMPTCFRAEEAPMNSSYRDPAGSSPGKVSSGC